MDIRLARIDDRLIHGQVATVWSKQTGVERIIVISDVVAQDKLRKFLLKEAAPPGITANVITVQKMIQIYHSGLLSRAKVMLLFTNQQDIDSFRYLNSQEVELEIRKVPADRKILLMELLAKIKKV